jgi:hypothetical protein
MIAVTIDLFFIPDTSALLPAGFASSFSIADPHFTQITALSATALPHTLQKDLPLPAGTPHLRQIA